MAVPPGFADVSVRLTLAGLSRPAYVTMGLDPTSADPDAVAASVRIAWNKTGSMNSRQSNTVTMGPVTVRIGQDGGEATVGIDEQLVVGAVSQSAPSAQVALLIHKRTARGGRRGRGRMFLPWAIAEGSVDEAGLILPATVTAYNAALEVFRLELAAQQCPMVVLHEPGRTTPGAPDVVTTLLADRLIATQRRRLGR